MKVENEKLGKFIQGMNNDEAHLFLITELTRVREEHKSERDEDRWVEVKNGKNRKMLMKEVVANTHDAVVDIRKDTQILRDFSGFFHLMRKYHLWWVVGIVLSITLGALGLDVSSNIIKNHLP